MPCLEGPWSWKGTAGKGLCCQSLLQRGVWADRMFSWVAPRPLQPSFVGVHWAASLSTPGGESASPDISPLGTLGATAEAGSTAHSLCSSAQPQLVSLPPQGAPARERPCSCSSVPARSTSSRPLSEPSKQPESRGMSTLGSDTVCATSSWLLSTPSSASSLPVS